MPNTNYSISFDEAQLLMNHCIEVANLHKVPGAIAIVDNGGHLIILNRLDHTMLSAANIAIGKAAPAVAFQRNTNKLEDVIQEGRSTMLVLNNVTPQPYVPLKGGYLIKLDNHIVGGIAVAGTMDASMDEVVAEEALKGFYNEYNKEI